jgi:hypothetical protein
MLYRKGVEETKMKILNGCRKYRVTLIVIMYTGPTKTSQEERITDLSIGLKRIL